jgi:hypothetical protein
MEGDAMDETKVRCPIIGTDGNAFALMARVLGCLNGAGQIERARAFLLAIPETGSYDAFLRLILQYVEPIHVDGDAGVGDDA